MTTATATISFRVKPSVKRRADALFARLGLSTSSAMNILLMQTLEHRGFAAPVRLPPDAVFDFDEQQENSDEPAT